MTSPSGTPATSPDRLLEVNGLTKAFGGLVAFSDVDLSISRGEILGLIGPNGAGKTTLINCITGVYKPTAGRILFKNHPISRLRPHQICRLGIGRTFQIPRPFKDMSVMDNIRVCTHRGSVDEKELLDMAGLWEKRHRLAKTLTFQERRLLELSRALAINPELLLLDETIAGLNPVETEEMMALLRRIHTDLNMTIIWIEHVMKAIMENASRIVVLHQGNLIAQGSPREVANNPRVIEAYLGEEYQFAEQEDHAHC